MTLSLTQSHYAVPTAFVRLWFLVIAMSVVGTSHAAHPQLNENGHSNVSLSRAITIMGHEDEDSISIGMYASIFEDPSQSLNLDDVKKKLGQFRPINVNTYNAGYTHSTFWLNFIIENKSSLPAKRYIRLSYPLVDEFILYYETNNTLSTKKKGRLFRTAETVNDDRAFRIEITLRPHQKIEYFIKVASKDSLTMPLRLLTEDGLRQAITADRTLVSLYYGIVIAMVIFSIFLLITLREQIYAHYLVMALTHHVFFFLLLNGFSSSIFGLHSLWWSREALTFFISLSMIAFIRFGRSFFRTKIEHPSINKLLNICIGLSVAGMILTFLVDHFYAIMFANISATITGVAMYALGIAAFRKGNKSALYYLYAWTIVIFGGIAYSAKTWALVPSNLLTEYVWQAGACIESVLLSMAIADRINTETRKREKAQNQVVSSHKSSVKNLQKYRHIYDNAPQGLFTLDHKGQFIQANLSLVRLLGYQELSDLVLDNSSPFTNKNTFIHFFPNLQEHANINDTFSFEIVK